MSIVARIVALATLAALGSACILAVPFADVGGSHCRLARNTTACGACLEDRCAAPIDGCCFDDQCGGVIGDLDACASGANEACLRVADATDRGGQHVALSTCATRECAAACAVPALNVTTCERAYVTSTESCECAIGKPPNTTTCTEIGHPDLRCCAPDDWPSPVRSCTCRKVLCVAAGAGCLCQLSPIDERDRDRTCSGAICCYDPQVNSCSCGASACGPQETKVASCSIDALGCEAGTHRVDSCSIAAP